MKNQKTYILIGTIALGGIVAYVIYKNMNKQPEVKYSEEEQTPTPTPSKTNPFKALLNQKFPEIKFKPTDYSYKNPFANVDTAIADNSLFNIKKDNDFIV